MHALIPTKPPEFLVLHFFVGIVVQNDQPMIVAIAEPLVNAVVDPFVSPSITRCDHGVVLGEIFSEFEELPAHQVPGRISRTATRILPLGRLLYRRMPNQNGSSGERHDPRSRSIHQILRPTPPYPSRRPGHRRKTSKRQMRPKLFLPHAFPDRTPRIDNGLP